MADHPTVTYNFVSNTTASAAEVNQNFADIIGYLDGRFGSATSGQIWVADASGRGTPRTVSGAVTISNTGVVTIPTDSITAEKIGAGEVGTSELANDSVTQAKLNLSATTDALAGAVSLSTPAWSDICTVTPPAGTYLAIGNVCVYAVGNDGQNGAMARFSTDSQLRAGVQFAPTDNNVFSIVIPVFKIATCDGVTALKLQARTFFATNPNDVRAMGTAWGQEPGESRLVCIPIS